MEAVKEKKNIGLDNSIKTYIDSKKGEFYFSNFYSPASKPWFFNFKNLKRIDITIINRMRSGHYNTSDNLWRKNLISYSSCNFCNSPQNSLNHFIFVCPIFKVNREILFKEWKNNEIKYPFSLVSLLKKPKIEFIAPLIKYIKSTGNLL